MNNDKSVSFIIVNYNGIDHLSNCFKALSELDYPKDKLEFIVVDNGSVDESVQFLEKNYPDAVMIKNSSNEGFAKPNDDAAKIAKGEYLALLNNDMRIDGNWLNDMLSTLNECKDDSYVCVGSKILNWDGSKIDFVEGSINLYGHGYQIDSGKSIQDISDDELVDKDILFACGGAMIIKRDIFLQIGGFDEDFFAYYEDCDLGWRLWILGYKVRFCSKAICYHKHNSTSKKMNRNFVLNLYARNSLFTIYKNYENEHSEKMVLISIILRNYLNENSSTNFPNEVLVKSASDFLTDIDKMSVKRDYIQQNRKRSDEFIFQSFIKDPMRNILTVDNAIGHYNGLKKSLESFQLNKGYFKSKLKILLIIFELVGEKMAGPAIRYFEFARELSKEHDVTLASLGKTNLDMSKENFKIVNFTHTDQEELFKATFECEVLIFQGLILELLAPIKNAAKGKFVVVDLYDPFNIELLESRKQTPIDRDIEMASYDLYALLEQIRLGDYFICASEYQKEFWLGMLEAYGKFDEQKYNIENIIDIVPFGITNRDPVLSKKLLNSKINNLKPDDKVFIWGGGVWNWFDPITIVKAIYEISKVRDDVKLFFLGVKHPNPEVKEMEVLTKTVELSEKLGIKDEFVFFNMDWVPYDTRENYFLESYAGISCHFDHLETRFSFRTRILDYLWCDLPIISTKGDFFGGEIEKHSLGITIEPEDVEDCMNAILRLIDDKEYYKECKQNVKAYKETLRWDKVIEPLEKRLNEDLIKLKEPEKIPAAPSTDSIWAERHYLKTRILVNLNFIGYPSIKQYIKNNVKIFLFFLFYLVIFKEILKVNQNDYIFFLVSGLIPYFFLDRTIRAYFSYCIPNLISSNRIIRFCDAASIFVVYSIFFLPIYLVFSLAAFIFDKISLINMLWCVLSYLNISALILFVLMVTMMFAIKKPRMLNRTWIGVLPFLVFILPVLFDASYLR
ncbi:MAG: glycosyltransferase, partial [Oscillospiraceae bacterium]|nr:glycosyltransferase [Oscillospiraceae bacterium]